MYLSLLQIKNFRCFDGNEHIVTDFAGNTVKKKLTSQYSLLSWFHTSIDRVRARG